MLRIEIKPGYSSNHVSELLYKKKIIRSKFLFNFYSKVTFTQKNIKAGFYEFAVGESYYSILKKLKDGKTSPVVFTIIEGQTFTEIKNKIAKSTFVKNSQFDIANTSKISKALNIEKHQNLEGLFYPDTYFFDYSVTGLEILQFAHEKQKEVLNSIWEKKTKKKISYKKKYESLILASIIEKETMLNAEKKIVSSVFHNRLKLRMKLQADPTVIYGLREKFTGNLKRRHLKEDNEYNTYTRYGLPPTPICSVSKSSLEAAINPSQTKFLYFVANRKGEHIFSSTLKEHNQNVFKYQKNQ